MRRPSKPVRQERSNGRKGYALLLAIGVLTIVLFTMSIVERNVYSGLEMSRMSVARAQTDWACYGAVMRTACNPPDALTRFDYYGTRVRVTLHDPPVEMAARLVGKLGSGLLAEGEQEASVRLYCAVSAAPVLNSSVESTWYYLVKESLHPEILASWPGIERLQPYQ